MSKYKSVPSAKFRKQYKLMKKRGLDMSILKNVVFMLENGEQLPQKYRDHELIGNYSGYRECHLQSDWLLVYKHEHDKLILNLYRTGTHSDIF